MIWWRGGKISAVYGLLGTLAFAGCAGSGNNTDLAANTGGSMGRPVEDGGAALHTPGRKIRCNKIPNAVRVTETLDSGGGTILVAATDTTGMDRIVAKLFVPPDAVKKETRFVVRVPRGRRAVASVRAWQDDEEFRGPFKDSLQLSLYYTRECKLGSEDADQVLGLSGFTVPDRHQDDEDPDPVTWVGDTRVQESITLKLGHLSGYILAQGIVGGSGVLPPPPPPSADTAASPVP
jgi:hypothetical protein